MLQGGCGRLVGLHLAVVVLQEHTRLPGPGRTKRNLVGKRLWPEHAFKSVSPLLLVAGLGARLPVPGRLVADFYGVAAYASINGVLAFTLTIARAAAPVAAAALRTATGSYHQVMAAVAVCSILASLAIARAHWLHTRQVIAPPG